jgi:catechol 2,3-dioxygenase-like lactoylglutathione lyase family enzyme
MSDNEFPAPVEGFVITYTLIVKDVKKSCDWYEAMLDGKVVMEPTADGTPAIIKVANTWIIINFGGGDGTVDKPDINVKVKEDQGVLSSFLNVRVADITTFYNDRKDRGNFITEPKDMSRETRCYMQDPDGYLIEVGQSK